jgi:tetratricopeptide (TPR) repeat protein
MMRNTSQSLLIVVVAVCLLAAAAPQAANPDELIRQANAAFLRGDGDDADRLYAAAEERTADPGLVAFNRAAVLFQKGEFRDAEVHYSRVLDDAACPADRAAKAWYNRGTCLLRRGGSATVFRSAIACLERVLDSDTADEPLKADARHNLELAKALWNEARKKDTKPDKPNENPPNEDPRSDPPPPRNGGSEENPGTTETGDGNNGQKSTRPVTQPNTIPNTNTTAPQAQNSGATPAPALKDESQVQALSPEDTRKHLRDHGTRIKKDQQDIRRALYGTPQPGIRDW